MSMHTPTTRAGAWFCTALLASQSITALVADKSQYTLFNPTPDNERRAMTLEQNTFVGNPFTVDAGTFQLEVDIVDYLHDESTPPGVDYEYEAWVFGFSQLRYGLCDRAEINVGFGGYTEITEKDRIAGSETKYDGYDNLNAGFKVNLWGNEGDTKTALGVSGVVVFPTSDITGWDTWSGGVALPFSAQLPYGIRLGLITGVLWYEDGAGETQVRFSNGISLERNIMDNLDGFVEYHTRYFEDSEEWTADINTGLNYHLNEDAQLYVGMTFGVRHSIDYWPFIGIAYRF